MKTDLPKALVLIRHGESSKNVSFSYSSLGGDEPLTKNGTHQVDYISKCCEKLISKGAQSRSYLFASPTRRTLQTAQPLAEKLGIPITHVNELAPLHDPSIAGKSIDVVHSLDHRLGREVGLYRAGLMSGYDVSWPSGGIRSLEQRVKRMIRERLTAECDLAIVVAHKSTLTCIVINVLRVLGSYPLEFYGYVDIETGAGISIDCKSVPAVLNFMSATQVYPRRRNLS